MRSCASNAGNSKDNGHNQAQRRGLDDYLLALHSHSLDFEGWASQQGEDHGLSKKDVLAKNIQPGSLDSLTQLHISLKSAAEQFQSAAEQFQVALVTLQKLGKAMNATSQALETWIQSGGEVVLLPSDQLGDLCVQKDLVHFCTPIEIHQVPGRGTIFTVQKRYPLGAVLDVDGVLWRVTRLESAGGRDWGAWVSKVQP